VYTYFTVFVLVYIDTGLAMDLRPCHVPYQMSKEL